MKLVRQEICNQAILIWLVLSEFIIGKICCQSTKINEGKFFMVNLLVLFFYSICSAKFDSLSEKFNIIFFIRTFQVNLRRWKLIEKIQPDFHGDRLSNGVV